MGTWRGAMNCREQWAHSPSVGMLSTSCSDIVGFFFSLLLLLLEEEEKGVLEFMPGMVEASLLLVCRRVTFPDLVRILDAIMVLAVNICVMETVQIL